MPNDSRHGLGGNNPPSDENTFRSDLEARHGPLILRRDELLAAVKRVPEIFETAEIAERAADFVKQLIAFQKTVDTTRTAEKAPHLERGRWVDSPLQGHYG